MDDTTRRTADDAILAAVTLANYCQHRLTLDYQSIELDALSRAVQETVNAYWLTLDCCTD